MFKRKEKREKRKEEKIKLISELVDDGNRLFESSGYSIIRVTRDGEAQQIKLRICTDGVRELMDELSAQAPRPPVLDKLIEKDSEEGRKLELENDSMIRMFDITDESYVDALDESTRKFTWKIVAQALSVQGTDDLDEKIRILKEKGITKNQVGRIYRDVMDLTRFAEDREDFLSGGVWA